MKSILAILLSITVLNLQAGQAHFESVSTDWVGTIVQNALNHKEGNFEIKITNGLNTSSLNAQGVTCDLNYITTKPDVKNFAGMQSIILAAHLSQKTIRISITDDPAMQAFPGRCSLLAVGINK